MKEPKGITKIKQSIKAAKEKGYTLALCKGAFSSFIEKKGLSSLDYQKQLEKFNQYLKKYGLKAISTRKGILYGYANEVKEYHSNNDFEW